MRYSLVVLLLLPVLAAPLAAQQRGLGVDAELLVGPPAAAPRSGEELDQLTEQLSALMRCPVCQGLSVADSPVDLAVDMKGEVREMLAAGFSEAQVLDYFERSYGEFIRLAPKAEGFNLTVWLAPIVAMLVGVGVVVWRLRSRKAAVPEPAAELSEYLERVRREVAG